MLDRRTSLRNDPAFVLAVIYTLAFVGIAFVMILVKIDDDNVAVAQQVLSIMSMIQAGIVGFFYGASKAAMDQHKGTNVQTDAATDITVKTGDAGNTDKPVDTQIKKDGAEAVTTDGKDGQK